MPIHHSKRSKDFIKLQSKENLALAWQRLLRAREPSYKWYWRPSLAVALKAKASILDRIESQLSNDDYDPDHVCLCSEPKPSKLLRHRSILSFRDHLVYQAICNVVADKLHLQVEKLYHKNVFGNLYIGETSEYFLKRWEEGYQTFLNANRKAFGENQKWLVQFDFASFFDSIGHGVLEHLLKELEVADDVCELLCKKLLPTWSSFSHESDRLRGLVLDTGIPQGPLGSPILAEVVLAYIDKHMSKLEKVTYLRYADDIRIWGATSNDVRYAAAVLDRLARNIGIFPQGKKFSVDRIRNVESVLKQISTLGDLKVTEEETEKGLAEELKKQLKNVRLTRLITKLSGQAELRENDITTFKYLLAATEANDEVAASLFDLMIYRPHLRESCCYYFERIEEPSRKVLKSLIDLIDHYPGYPWMSGRLLRVLWLHRNCLIPSQKKSLQTKVTRLSQRNGIRTDCQLQGISLLMGIHLGVLDTLYLEQWFADSKTSWWAIVHVVLNIEGSKISNRSLCAMLTKLLRHPNRDVALAACQRLCILEEKLPIGLLEDNLEYQEIVEAFHPSGKGTESTSRISTIYNQILSQFEVKSELLPLPTVDWAKLLGTGFLDFAKQTTFIYAETGATRDVFCKLLLSAWEPVILCLWKKLNCTDLDHDTGQVLEKNENGVLVFEMFRKNTDLSQKMPHLCEFMAFLQLFVEHLHHKILFRYMQVLLEALAAGWIELSEEFSGI